jgi:EAL domain-containing protein (putative c-di-GMP-specific phosphodiesterase class I)
VAIVVDDFGVGYSSLASLRSEYVRQVKIDRSFILGLSSSPGNVVLVDAIVQLGRSLNIQVVAEGVENAGRARCAARAGLQAGAGLLLHAARAARQGHCMGRAARRRGHGAVLRACVLWLRHAGHQPSVSNSRKIQESW